MAEKKSEGIKTPFKDAVVKKQSTTAGHAANANGESNLPKRTPSPNSVDEVNRCKY